MTAVTGAVVFAGLSVVLNDSRGNISLEEHIKTPCPGPGLLSKKQHLRFEQHTLNN
jgi:hypothetical protein